MPKILLRKPIRSRMIKDANARRIIEHIDCNWLQEIIDDTEKYIGPGFSLFGKLHEDDNAFTDYYIMISTTPAVVDQTQLDVVYAFVLGWLVGKRATFTME